MVLVLSPAAATPGGAGQAVLCPARVTHCPQLPSLHGGMLGERSSPCIPAACCPGSSLAVCSCFLLPLNKGREQGGGCSILLLSRDFSWLPVENGPSQHCLQTDGAAQSISFVGGGIPPLPAAHRDLPMQNSSPLCPQGAAGLGCLLPPQDLAAALLQPFRAFPLPRI